MTTQEYKFEAPTVEVIRLRIPIKPKDKKLRKQGRQAVQLARAAKHGDKRAAAELDTLIKAMAAHTGRKPSFMRAVIMHGAAGGVWSGPDYSDSFKKSV